MSENNQQPSLEEALLKFDREIAAERARLERDAALKRTQLEADLKAKGIKSAAETAKEKEADCPNKGSEKCKTCPTKDQCGSHKHDSECANKGSSKCNSCPSRDRCGGSGGNSTGIAQDDISKEIGYRMQFIKNKILVLSGKGGVGKSMVSSQIAFALAERGHRVGLLDVDICGPCVPRMMGVHGTSLEQTPDGIEPMQVNERLFAVSIGLMVENEGEAIIWRGARKIGLIQVFLKDIFWGELDYLIIDTPPGTSDEHLSTVQLLQKADVIDGAVIVTSPQDVAVGAVRKEINFCHRMNLNVLGLIENMSGFKCKTCGTVCDIFSPTTGGGEALAKETKVPFAGKIPLDPVLAQDGDNGKKTTSKDANCAIDEVINCLLKNIKARQQKDVAME